MARESINLLQQLGLQGAVGTPVAADTRLTSLAIDLSDSIETKQFRGSGAKAITTSAIHKLWAQGSFNGPLNYVEICYILASLVPYTVQTTTGVSTWNFLPNPTGSDAFEVYTLEIGDDEETEQYQDMQFISSEMSWQEDDVMVSGNVISKPKAVLGGGLTAGAVPVAEVPVLRSQIDMYADALFANIGTTKLADAFEGKFTVGDKFEPKWVLNSAEASYKEMVEKIADLELTMTIEANAQGRTLVNDVISNNTSRYIQIQSSGANIPAGTPTTPYSMRLQAFCKVKNVEPLKDYRGTIYAYQITWVAMDDANLGRAWNMRVINGLAAL